MTEENSKWLLPKKKEEEEDKYIHWKASQENVHTENKERDKKVEDKARWCRIREESTDLKVHNKEKRMNTNIAKPMEIKNKN